MIGPKYRKKNTLIWIPCKKNKVNEIKQKVPTTFQKSLKVTLMIGQALSMIPVNGAWSGNAANVKFSYTSWRSIYSFLSLIGNLFLSIICIYKITQTIEDLNETDALMTYGTTCITLLMSYQVARSWPSLVRHIAQAEELDPIYDSSLAYKCNFACALVMILGLMEHILSLLSEFARTVVCHPMNTFFEGWFRRFFPYVFNFLPYSFIFGVIAQFFHFQSAFIWNFSDLFVICMSYYLSFRLQHINKKLLRAQRKYLPETFWKSIREEYCRSTKLVRRVDNVISGITFMSFVNNLFFTCLQLFNTLQGEVKDTGECSRQSKSTTLLGGYEGPTYFIFSLVFQISRSVAVLLIASQVNTASMVPASILYNVPSPVYCDEVQRFLDQVVNGDKVALSGLQFFYVTRKLLLTVVGAITTYELVMFQFTSPEVQTMSPNITTTVATF